MGKLFFSCINKEALPLLRYRTHDISYITREKCECGRTLVRLMKPSGRTDDMIIVRDINVFPSQIESVLLSVKGVSPHSPHNWSTDHDNHDTIEVKVEVSPEIFSDKIRGLQSYAEEIQRKMDSVPQISAKITFVEPGTLPRSKARQNASSTTASFTHKNKGGSAMINAGIGSFWKTEPAVSPKLQKCLLEWA